MTSMIEMADVDLEYGHKRVLQGLTLAVQAGEFLALLGPSGCGKSTILRLILGFIAPTRGQLRIAGEIVSRNGSVLSPPEARRLAVVFQDLALWPHLSVHQNLAFGLAAQGVAAAERERRIAAMLDRVGLSDMAQRYPGALSGGERQRVAIARALVQKPRAVLLDEPLANVDAQSATVIMNALQRIRTGRTCMIITHNPALCTIADEVLHLQNGRLIPMQQTA